MSWLLLGLFSAIVMGIYELLKKQSVKDNAVLPVLFLSIVTSALVWIPFVIWSYASPANIPHTILLVQPLNLQEHMLMVLKSAIVSGSWVFSYFALKHLPITMAAPIRSTSPLFVLAGAIFIYNEAPSLLQWVGIILTIGFFIGISFAGRKEGINFESNRWVGFLIIGTVLAGISRLFDKNLLGAPGLYTPTLKAWFSIYLVGILLVPAYGWWKGWWSRSAFQWRWSIPLIGLTLLVVDFLYFEALTDPDAMVSVVSCLRRGSVLISFSIGYALFGERNFLLKLPFMLGILAGIILLVIG